jgi:hypothetical protein
MRNRYAGTALIRCSGSKTADIPAALKMFMNCLHQAAGASAVYYFKTIRALDQCVVNRLVYGRQRFINPHADDIDPVRRLQIS